MQITHFKSDTIADATGTITGWYGTSTVTVAATDVVRPSDWNSNHALALTVTGNTTIGSTVSGSVIPFAGSGGVSIGVSASTLVISGAGVSTWGPFQLGNNTSYSSFGQNTMYIQPVVPTAPVYFSSLELLARGSFVSSTDAEVYAHTIRYGLYVQDSGTNSSRMTLTGSSSQLVTASFNSSTSNAFTLSGGGTSFTTSAANSSIMTQLSGPFIHDLPFTSTLDPGRKYAIGMLISSATTANTNPWRYAPLVQTQMNSLSFARIGSAAFTAPGTTVVGENEMVVYNTTTGAMPASYAASQVSIGVSRQILPMTFKAV